MEAMGAIWHELPEILDSEWQVFSEALFAKLNTEAADKTNEQVAQEIIDHFQRYEKALAVLERKYQELSFEQSGDYTIIPVYFATTRHYAESGDLARQFTGRRDNHIHYGMAEVTIPPDHRMGNLEQPRWWGSASTDKHVTLYSLTKLSQSEFASRADGSLAMSRNERQWSLFMVIM